MVQEALGAGDLSTLSIMGAIPVCFPYRHAAPLEMTVATSAPPVMFIKKGRGSAAGCVEGLHPTGKTTHYILCVAFVQGAGRKGLMFKKP